MSIRNVRALASLCAHPRETVAVRPSRARGRRPLPAAMLLAALGSPLAWAADITVNSLADGSVSGDGQCTLREAMINADTDSASSADCAAGNGADTITFIGAAARGTISIASRLPTITSPAGLTIDGADAITVSAINPFALTRIDVLGGALTLKRLTLADLGGGAIGALFAFNATLTIVDSRVLRGGSVGNGGGLLASNSDLTVLRSTFSGNKAENGGGIYALGKRLTISHSTFAKNASQIFGGAVVVDEGALLTVSNSTFVGNQGGSGGGVLVQDGTADFTNTTFFRNSALFDGASVASQNSSVTLRNTLLGSAFSNPHCSGAILDGGGNLDDGVSCGFSQATSKGSTPAGLDPAGLKDNGGATQTIALCSGADKPAGCSAVSAAVDAGDAAICAAAPVNNVDQRGKPRPADGDANGTARCDIGAFEVQPAAFPFAGFFEPVDNLPTLNTVKAGAGVPVKFSLGGNRGLDILAAGYPQSQPVVCDSGAPQDALEQTVAAGGSSLGYDAATDTYTYVWKTEKFWAGQCRQLVVRLVDGTDHSAQFKLK